MWLAICLVFFIAALLWFLSGALVREAHSDGASRGPVSLIVSICLLALLATAGGIYMTYEAGNGLSTTEQRLHESAVYELVWQGAVDGKPVAVLVEMRGAQDFTSTDRTDKFFQLPEPISGDTKYFKANKKDSKVTLVPFALPGGAK